mgnify:CR=1 FL=1
MTLPINSVENFSAQSRAFSYFIDHIFDNFHHLVHDNLNWWRRNGFWAKSAEAIEVRMAERYQTDNKNLVSHFIDCNCLPTTVTGGGPAEGGANAATFLLTYCFYSLVYMFRLFLRNLCIYF